MTDILTSKSALSPPSLWVARGELGHPSFLVFTCPQEARHHVSLLFLFFPLVPKQQRCMSFRAFLTNCTLFGRFNSKSFSFSSFSARFKCPEPGLRPFHTPSARPNRILDRAFSFFPPKRTDFTKPCSLLFPPLPCEPSREFLR